MIGMTIVTISFGMKNVRAIRYLTLLNSPLWLTYNIFAFSVGGIICEILAISSTVIAIFRFDIKRTKLKDGGSAEKTKL